MDDPELMKFPIAYLSEPGYWYPNDSEANGLRTYLEKGGFLIVDDPHFQHQWDVLEAAMRRVLPGSRIERLAATPRGYLSRGQSAGLPLIETAPKWR